MGACFSVGSSTGNSHLIGKSTSALVPPSEAKILQAENLKSFRFNVLQEATEKFHPNNESIPQQMTVSEPIQSAIPQTVEEVTPLEFHETLSGNSSGVAITTVKSIGLQLYNGYILKTPLKATTVEATTVTSVPVGSPQNQEKWAFVYDDLESSPIIKTNTTTTGRNSNDPIKLGDELRYKDLTDRMTSMETSIANMKEMMRQMMGLSKCQPSTHKTKPSPQQPPQKK
ncbi:hypothetical protein HanPI659440_Chr15g0617411 [Helianthus annuus]|nr:hypothetical protein HanPI659440_Chr15g0617411 [Helianthus annuus]